MNKDTLKEAGYIYDSFLGNGQHQLKNLNDGKMEVWYANKNHASYGIKYKNTHLEFGYSIPD